MGLPAYGQPAQRKAPKSVAPQRAPHPPAGRSIDPGLWKAGNRAMAQLLQPVRPAAAQRTVQRDGPQVTVPKEGPSAIVPGTPGSKRKLSELEKGVLGAWYQAYQGSHAPTELSILAISEDVQTIAGLVRQEVFKYEFGRDKVKAELAMIERFEEANSLEGSIMEVLLGLPLVVSGLGALTSAATVTVEILASIAIDQTVGALQGEVSSSMSVARAVSAGLADTSVLTSTSFDGLLKVMDALHMAHLRSNEYQRTRMLNDLRVHIFARTQPVDDDPVLAERATTLLAAISDDRVRSALAALQAKVHRSLIEIRTATWERTFSDYQRIWLIALDRSPALRGMMRRANPTGAIVKRLLDARIVEQKGGLVPLVGYPEFAAEHYQIVFGVVPVR